MDQINHCYPPIIVMVNTTRFDIIFDPSSIQRISYVSLLIHNLRNIQFPPQQSSPYFIWKKENTETDLHFNILLQFIPLQLN